MDINVSESAFTLWKYLGKLNVNLSASVVHMSMEVVEKAPRPPLLHLAMIESRREWSDLGEVRRDAWG
jgi:hypothetical protein